MGNTRILPQLTPGSYVSDGQRPMSSASHAHSAPITASPCLHSSELWLAESEGQDALLTF